MASTDGTKTRDGDQSGPLHNANGTSPDVTKRICRFIADAKYEALTAASIAKLKDLIIDHLGVASGAAAISESTESFMKAIAALGGSTGGTSTVYAKGKTFRPQYAALLNGALAHSLDFDDTCAIGPLHPGVCVIPAALTQAELSGCDGRTLLTALAVGYEVTCRLGRALSTGGYARGFHNTSTCGLFGAVAAIAVIKGLSEAQVEDAVGLAGSRAAGCMQFLENGSWNKRLHPGFAAHDAFVVVALAEAGVVGAEKPLEGKFGFLHSYSTKEATPEVLEELVRGLGENWFFVITALKPFAACRMTHSTIETLAKMAASLRTKGKTDMPEKITIRLSPACWPIVGPRAPNKVHPRTIVDAQFSIYYQAAVAWLRGAELGWAVYEPALMAEAEVAALCERIECVPDPDVADLEARITVRWANIEDGAEEAALVYPLGEDQNPFSSEKVKAKFRSLASHAYGADRAAEIAGEVDGLETARSVGALMALL